MMSDPVWMERMIAFSDNDAFCEKGVYYKYSDMIDAIDNANELLKDNGIQAGESVILNDDFSFNSICMLFALAINKNIVVPIVNLTQNNLMAINQNLNIKHIVTATGGLNIEPSQFSSEKVKNQDLNKIINSGQSGLVLLSSGSTGKPKLILHDFDNLLNSKISNKPNRKLKTLLFLLFDHIGGLNTALNIFLTGGVAVAPAERTPIGVAQTIESESVSIFPTSPTFLNLMLLAGAHEKHCLESVRLITYGTEAMPESLLKRVREAFPKAKLLQTFGTSETGISKTVSKSSTSTAFKFNDEGMDFKVVDGELYLKSKTQFIGYLNYDKESVDEEGWFKTGDEVECSKDGYIQIIGRKKEIINVGGEKVLPLELESILHDCPIIKDCMVFGQHNAMTGNIVCVDVQLNQEMNRSQVRREIHNYLKDKVEHFKIPTKINIVKEIGFTERFKKLRASRL
jgi:acyl-coenzyme A synthetase/AMP-(fatty) acid ligase